MSDPRAMDNSERSGDDMPRGSQQAAERLEAALSDRGGRSAMDGARENRVASEGDEAGLVRAANLLRNLKVDRNEQAGIDGRRDLMLRIQRERRGSRGLALQRRGLMRLAAASLSILLLFSGLQLAQADSDLAPIERIQALALAAQDAAADIAQQALGAAADLFRPDSTRLASDQPEPSRDSAAVETQPARSGAAGNVTRATAVARDRRPSLIQPTAVPTRRALAQAPALASDPTALPVPADVAPDARDTPPLVVEPSKPETSATERPADPRPEETTPPFTATELPASSTPERSAIGPEPGTALPSAPPPTLTATPTGACAFRDGSIQGRVVDPNMRLVADAEVLVSSRGQTGASPTVIPPVRSDVNGFYRVSGLCDGVYTVDANGVSASQTMAGFYDPDGDGVPDWVTLSLSQRGAQDIDIALGPRRAGPSPPATPRPPASPPVREPSEPTPVPPVAPGQPSATPTIDPNRPFP